MGSFRDLRVWQVGMELSVVVYRLTRKFPGHELYSLNKQVHRAAVSVPSNLAEGYMRNGVAEYRRHVSIARGSLAEVETQLELAFRLGYLTEAELSPASELIDLLGRQLTVLNQRLSRSPLRAET